LKIFHCQKIRGPCNIIFEKKIIPLCALLGDRNFLVLTCHPMVGVCWTRTNFLGSYSTHPKWVPI
jgi:hypothetical protein